MLRKIINLIAQRNKSSNASMKWWWNNHECVYLWNTSLRMNLQQILSEIFLHLDSLAIIKPNWLRCTEIKVTFFIHGIIKQIIIALVKPLNKCFRGVVPTSMKDLKWPKKWTSQARFLQTQITFLWRCVTKSFVNMSQDRKQSVAMKTINCEWQLTQRGNTQIQKQTYRLL